MEAEKSPEIYMDTEDIEVVAANMEFIAENYAKVMKRAQR